MSANNKQKKAVKQNVSRMAAGILNELIKQVDELPFNKRVKVAWLVLRGKW